MRHISDDQFDSAGHFDEVFLRIIAVDRLATTREVQKLGAATHHRRAWDRTAPGPEI
jgi:hypothetical protein